MLPPSGLLSVLAVCLLTRVVQGENQGCVDIPTENNIKMEDVEGTWHPMEIVLHRNDSKIYGVPLDTKCPVVTFSPAPKNKKILLMVWNATEGDIEYRFQLKGPKAGQWQATGDQAGIGSKSAILVVAVDKYMIIRLCTPTMHNTILLSKQSARSQQLLDEASNERATLVKYPAYERMPLCAGGAVLWNLSTSLLLTSISILVLLLRQ